jgi:hypothetical protein
MAHIILPSSELATFQAIANYLPNGTSLVEQDDKDGKCLKRYVVDHSQPGLKLDKDFVEDAKPFSLDEEKNFTKSLTKTKVIDFFLLGHEIDDHPYREYDACSNKLYELCKYIRNTGYHVIDEENYTTIGAYQIRLEKNADLLAARKEIEFLVGRIKKKAPGLEEYSMSIMEESLAATGCYSMILDLKAKKAKITCTTYGHTSDVNDWDTLSNTLVFIQRRLPAPTY